MKAQTGYMVLVAVYVMALNLFFPVGAFLTGWVISLALLAFCKINLCYHMFCGHGVNLRKIRTFYGWPILFALCYLVLVGTIGYVLSIVYHSHFFPDTMNNLKHFGWSMMGGVVAAGMFWFTHARWRYFFGSQYYAYLEFRSLGYSHEQIMAEIERLKAKDIFGLDTERPDAPDHCQVWR